jgi:uncharacterized protein (TIGR03546 family)
MLTLRDKLVAAIRGGGHPAGVAIAVALGLVAGFASGVNLTFAMLLWLAIVLNVRSVVFVSTWAIGLALAIGGHSICHGVGYALLDELRLGELIAKLGDSPIVALLDWDRYALVGGVAMAIVLAVPAARGAWTVADARWRAAHEANPPRRTLMRPLAWLYAPIAAVPLVFLPWVLVERQLSDEILGEAVAFSDCRATAERTELCLLTGAWLAENVTIVSREQPDKPTLRVERIQAKLDSSRLLRGWLHIDDLKLSGVTRFETPRTTFDGANREAATGATDLNELVVGWSERRDLLAWSSQALGLFDRLAKLDQQQSNPSQEQLFGSLASTPDEPRSRLGRRQPRVVINSVRLTELSPAWHLGGKASIEIEHLNSNPRLALYPTRVKVIAPEWSSEAEVTMNLHDAGQRHQLKVRAIDLPLAELLDPARTRSRLVVHRGLISALGEGWIDVQRVYLPLTLDSQQLSAQVLGSQPVADLSTDHWNRCLRELGGLRFDSLVSGHWNDLHITLETQEVVKQLKHQLRSAGAHDLLAGVDEEQNGNRAQLAATPVNNVVSNPYPVTNANVGVNTLPANDAIPAGGYPTTTEPVTAATPFPSTPFPDTSLPQVEPSPMPVAPPVDPPSTPVTTTQPVAAPFAYPVAETAPAAPVASESYPVATTPYPSADTAPTVSTPVATITPPAVAELSASPSAYPTTPLTESTPIAATAAAPMPTVSTPAPLEDIAVPTYPSTGLVTPTTIAAPQTPIAVTPTPVAQAPIETQLPAPSVPVVSESSRVARSEPIIKAEPSAPIVTSLEAKPTMPPATAAAATTVSDAPRSTVSDAPRSTPQPVKARVSAPAAEGDVAGYIGNRPYYSTRQQTGVPSTNPTSPGPINMQTGPDMEGLYARGQVNGPANPALPQQRTVTPEPKPAESGFAKWTSSVSNKFSSMFSRSSETSSAKPNGSATAAALAKAKTNPTTSPPPRVTGATSFASDAANNPNRPSETANKSWLDNLRR